MYLEDTERPVYDPYREVWIRWAFLTSVLTGLLAALSIWLAVFWGNQAALNGLQQQRHWANYQTLTSKTETLRSTRNFLQVYQLLEHKNPKLSKYLEEKLKEQEKDLAALEEEWEQFKAATERLESQGEKTRRRSLGAARTTVLWLVALALAVGGGLGRKKLLWLISLIITLAGLVSFVGAIFWLL